MNLNFQTKKLVGIGFSLKSQNQRSRKTLPYLQLMAFWLLIMTPYGLNAQTDDETMPQYGPYEAERQRYAEQMSKICPEMLNPDEVTVLRFADEAELILRVEGAELRNRNIQLQDLAGTLYNTETKGTLLYARVPLNSNFRIIYTACGKTATLAEANSLPSMKEDVVEVSDNLFRALADRPRDFSHDQWLGAQNQATYTEKLSFLQKHLLHAQPLDNRLRLENLSTLNDILYASKLNTDPLPCYCNQGNNPGDVIPAPGDPEDDCNCTYIVVGSSIIKNFQNEIPTLNHNIWNSYNYKGLTNGLGPQTYDHPAWGIGPRHSTDHWRHQVGATFDTKLKYNGWCSGPYCAPEEEYGYTNLDGITWPVMTSGQFGSPSADYQATYYGLVCSNGVFSSDCGCEKEVEAIFNYGYRMNVSSEIGTWANNFGKAFGFVGATAWAMYKHDPNPIHVFSNAKVIEETCNSQWNQEWVASFGRMAAATWAIGQAVIQDPITFGQVTPQMVSDFFTTKISLLQTNLVTQTCGGNNPITETALIPDGTYIKLSLKPNQFLYFFLAGYYDMRVKGKKKFTNEVNIQTYAGLATKLDRNSNALPSGGDPKLCCSESYGNYILFSNGANINNKLKAQQNWANFFLFTPTSWHPQFTRGMWGYLDIEGEYGRLQGPHNQSVCPNPIDIPMHKKENDIQLYSYGREIYIKQTFGSENVNYNIVDISGKLIKSGITTSPFEKILNNGEYNSSGIVLIQFNHTNYTKTHKIFLP